MNRPPVLEIVPKTYNAACQREAVKILRDALAQAEAGEIVSVALVATMPDGATFTAHSMMDDVHMVVSGLARLQHRIIASTEASGR